MDVADARRLELWRLELFELTRLDASGWSGIDAFYGVSRDDYRDERIICFAEVDDVGPAAPHAPDLALFEERFHEAIEAMRSIQGQRDPEHRLQWNRLYLFVRQPIALTNQLLTEALRRLAPETGHLGLEKVIVRIANHIGDAPSSAPRLIELLAGNPTGSRIEWTIRDSTRSSARTRDAVRAASRIGARSRADLSVRGRAFVHRSTGRRQARGWVRRRVREASRSTTSSVAVQSP